MSIKYIVDDDYYVALDPDGNQISRGSKKDKRYVDIIEHSQAHGVSGEYRIIQPEVKVGLVGGNIVQFVPPPNIAPEWTGTPIPTWSEGVGGTYDLKDDTFDPEDDPLTFVKTAGSFPTGVTLNSNGVLTATNSVVEGTTAGFTVTADDGTASPVASPSFSIIIGASSGLTFPLLAIGAIGGYSNNSFDNSRPGGFVGRWTRVAAHDLVLVGAFREWNYDGSTGPETNRSELPDYIKTLNANIIIYSYTFGGTDIRPTSNLDPWPLTRTKWTAETWYLYDGTGFSEPDDVLIPSGNFPDWQGNHSVHAPDDGDSVSPAEWTARAQHGKSTDGEDWTTAGFGIRAEYNFDGVYQDIFRINPRTSGDWDRDGNTDPKADTLAMAANAGGHIAYHAEWDVLEPTFLHGGNCAQIAGTTTELTNAITHGLQNLVNMCFLEAAMGRSSSFETFAGWDGMMRMYKRGMVINEGMDPQHTFFDAWAVDGFSESDPNVWDQTHSLFDWQRYGLTSALQDNGYYGLNTSGGMVDCYILDEYSFNLGGAIDEPNYDGTDPKTSNSGSGYNDFEQNVYLRRFDNGLAIVNPKGNGTQTITLSSAGGGFHWERLDATDYDNQDPTTNDGATVTTQQLPERHGIIIARVAD